MKQKFSTRHEKKEKKTGSKRIFNECYKVEQFNYRPSEDNACTNARFNERRCNRDRDRRKKSRVVA